MHLSFQVSLQYFLGKICGGSILNPEWILTAAHCASLPASYLSVVSGTNVLSSGGTKHDVTKVIIHESYNSSDSWINDIAVMQVSYLFSHYGTQPVMLTEKHKEPSEGIIATVIGWGKLSENGSGSDELRKVDIFITNKAKCDGIYYSEFQLHVYPTQICASVPEGNKGSCSGDSGGPLFVNGEVVGLGVAFPNETLNLKMGYLAPLLIFALLGNAFGLEDAPVCPQRKRNLQPYIVGGDPVESREFPGFVSIRINDTHKCGGAILNPDWILTIAHCMVYDTSSYSVVAGSDQLSSGGTNHKVTDIIIHWGYDMDDSWYNDIAVAKVKPPIELGGECEKVTLPSEGHETGEGESGTIIGFGAKELGGSFSEELRKVNVTIFNHDKCAAQYLSECNRTVHDTQMCAGGNNKGFCSVSLPILQR
ncbi:hypothetical protein J437_LFUL009259 [Ladona fulva]|uniref:Peptidase S1 domain-containing protein n=1 Tax=Ladona fulva TaxID=123851 RepID=A0A8K0P4B7_LADFU|nr:hypothetical protein J437_LFUL009259 [Ladona fulva]